MKVIPSDQTLGVKVEGMDLSKTLSQEEFDVVLKLLGDYGVVCFSRQKLDAVSLKHFSSRFGSLEINVANSFQEPAHPEVMILSNIVENGKPIGIADAGQDWHTDMSYSSTIAFANVLYAIKVPRRNGQALGCTSFLNMHAAYDDLPGDVREKLKDATAVHDFNKFWEMMRREKGSTRPPLTPEQRKAKPPVSHPVFLTHPITGKKVLYANPGYTVKINGWPEKESEEMLEFLFAHQLNPKYQYTHVWNENDVLMWENIGTLHNAVADYGPDEPRLIKRCQVMADWIFDSPQAKAVGADRMPR
ncbi:TauD/TfdA dioxygenase family protein [Billgrantia endophytica]|uniref:Taurine dioxygenase n=1 Tax=Billgrantia endophytica TaxID=2033802 RepID=A0A2N7TXU5_9GAMM|nr:TauD/TfdA family dioxygenase [Halomonas endophytica]PMR73007.1 taurine dioxygenase [Halomonas endophytica]